jgi:hypothetical protein
MLEVLIVLTVSDCSVRSFSSCLALRPHAVDDPAMLQGLHDGAVASNTSGAGMLDAELLTQLEQLLTCPISHVSQSA